MDCVEEVFDANHATHELISHVMRELSVCLEPARFIIIDNLYAFYHIEPGDQYQYVWISTAGLGVVSDLNLRHHLL